MTHVPSSPVEELALLDRELVWLDSRRGQLLHRRAWLVAAGRAWPAPTWQPPSGAGPQAAPPAWGPPARQAPAVGGTRGVQHVLLILGGLLLAVAAVAFTLVGWGEMGIAGRSVVLAAVTAGTLAAPVPLLRRGLTATAEAVAGLGLLLTVLDAYALHAAVVPGAEGPGFAALASAALAAVWTAYGLGLGRLRLPLPAAVVAGQFPLVLWAWSAGASPLGFGWALLATAAAGVLAGVGGRGLEVRAVAWLGAAVAGAAGLLIGLGASLAADGPLDAAGPGALLLTGAVVALAAGWRAPGEGAVAGGVVAGLAVVAGVGGVPRTEVPGSWAVVVYLLCGAAPALLWWLEAVPRPVRRGVLGASAAVTGLAVLTALPAVTAVLLGPAALRTGVWSGAPEGVRDVTAVSGVWPDAVAAPVVLLVAAVLLGAGYAAARVREGGPRTGSWAVAGAGVLGLGWVAALVLTVVAEAPYAVALAVDVVLVAGVLAVAARPVSDALARTGLWCAVAGAVNAGLLALAAEPATYAVAGAFVVLLAAGATYEQRLRDARRVRDSLGRMR
ncbi:hypothetical protein [Streptomyces sp. NPDC058374]|uniref:hypothetical protein n=1 Tax=unclassified Streptomyces TaxID=2593676 RepID=UPI00364986DB